MCGASSPHKWCQSLQDLVVWQLLFCDLPPFLHVCGAAPTFLQLWQVGLLGPTPRQSFSLPTMCL